MMQVFLVNAHEIIVGDEILLGNNVKRTARVVGVSRSGSTDYMIITDPVSTGGLFTRRTPGVYNLWEWDKVTIARAIT